MRECAGVSLDAVRCVDVGVTKARGLDANDDLAWAGYRNGDRV
jgi:hypothetical protein